MTRKNEIRITQETINKAADDLRTLLETHAVAIGQAYITCDNEISISLSVKIQPSKGAGEVDLITGISFTKDKIRDSIKTTLDPDQKPLFKGLKPAIVK